MVFQFNINKLIKATQDNDDKLSGSVKSSEDNTAKNAGKTAENTSGDNSIQQYALQIREQIQKMCDPTNGMTEKQKSDYDQKILRKIHRGEKLSQQEMEYIRIHYPEMYPQVVRVQIQRKSLETQLKNCRSKEQVELVSTSAMLRVSKNDPAYQALMAAYENVTEEFKKSDAYKSLPATDEEAKKLKQKDSNKLKYEESEDKSTLVTSSGNEKLDQYFSQEEFCSDTVYQA